MKSVIGKDNSPYLRAFIGYEEREHFLRGIWVGFGLGIFASAAFVMWLFFYATP